MEPAAHSANPDDASTTGSNATEERGSKDATRLSSVREIEDFPLAARIRRILATSRESVALSNDSESREPRAPRAFWIPQSVSEHYPSAPTDAYTGGEPQVTAMEGRRVWVSVGGEPRLGTVVERTFTPKKGSELLAVELDEPTDGTEKLVVNPNVDDVLFED